MYLVYDLPDKWAFVIIASTKADLDLTELQHFSFAKIIPNHKMF